MSEQNPVEQQNEMIAVANELFDGVTSEVQLASRLVTIRAAKVKDLAFITNFVQAFVNNFDATELLALLGKVSGRQTQALKEGVSPYSLDTAGMVKDFAGNISLALRIMESGVEHYRTLVPHFTDLEPEDFDELDLDEASLVTFAVFGRNYHFFTQRVLPVIRASIASLQQKQSSAK